MFRFSNLSSAARLAVVALAVAGLAAAAGLPLCAAAYRVIPEVVPVVGKTSDSFESEAEASPPEQSAPEASELDAIIPPEQSEPETGGSEASMATEDILAALQAIIDAESSAPEAPAPEVSRPEASAPEAAPGVSRAEQAAPEQAAQDAAAALAAQQAQQQAEQAAAEEQARREAEEAARGTPFPFSQGQYSADKGGYFDRTDGGRTIVAARFPTGNYVSSRQITYNWMGEDYPAVQYVADSGMVVVEIIFF